MRSLAVFVYSLICLASIQNVSTLSVQRQQYATDTARRSLIAATLLVVPALSATAATTPEITDRIFVRVKGLPGYEQPPTIIIGLYGNDSPNSVAKIKQLVTSDGLPANCRPKAERVLQREQLEANKVYNSCIEGQDEGVTLRYSNIWRIVKDERINVGDVRGKFVAREYPDWQDDSLLKHDTPGTVSVRRGNDGGFGFTIYPGSGDTKLLNDDNIVVGRVVEGMNVVEALNNVPVIASSKAVNYMALTGGPTTKNAPTRACRYGGPMYCNENKPLVKLSFTETGIAQ